MPVRLQRLRNGRRPFLAHVADVVEAAARKRGDPEAQAAQINDAVAAARAVTRAVTHPRSRCTPGAVRAVLSRVPVYLLDGSSPDADGVGVRPGFEALFADFAFADVAGRFTRSFLAAGSESHATSHPLNRRRRGRELAPCSARRSSSNDVTAAVSCVPRVHRRTDDAPGRIGVETSQELLASVSSRAVASQR